MSKDGRYYNLSTSEADSNGIIHVKWWKYTADETLPEAQTGEQEIEYYTPYEEFQKMIESECGRQ
jgi:hypothetical protein